jgi:hypothetical protein
MSTDTPDREPTAAEKAEQDRWAEIWEQGEDHDD